MFIAAMFTNYISCEINNARSCENKELNPISNDLTSIDDLRFQEFFYLGQGRM